MHEQCGEDSETVTVTHHLSETAQATARGRAEALLNRDGFIEFFLSSLPLFFPLPPQSESPIRSPSPALRLGHAAPPAIEPAPARALARLAPACLAGGSGWADSTQTRPRTAGTVTAITVPASGAAKIPTVFMAYRDFLDFSTLKTKPAVLIKAAKNASSIMANNSFFEGPVRGILKTTNF